jgi:hypothetical protein
MHACMHKFEFMHAAAFDAVCMQTLEGTIPIVYL